jgi:hypothetical protein
MIGLSTLTVSMLLPAHSSYGVAIVVPTSAAIAPGTPLPFMIALGADAVTAELAGSVQLSNLLGF